MSRTRSEVEAPGRPTRLAALGRTSGRAGLVITATAVPVGAAAFLALVLDAPTAGAGVDAALAAASGPLAVPGPLAGIGPLVETGLFAGSGSGGVVGWLFHVAVLGVLVGTWLLGLGQVLSGLFD